MSRIFYFHSVHTHTHSFWRSFSTSLCVKITTIHRMWNICGRKKRKENKQLIGNSVLIYIFFCCWLCLWHEDDIAVVKQVLNKFLSSVYLFVHTFDVFLLFQQSSVVCKEALKLCCLKDPSTVLCISCQFFIFCLLIQFWILITYLVWSLLTALIFFIVTLKLCFFGQYFYNKIPARSSSCYCFKHYRIRCTILSTYPAL